MKIHPLLRVLLAGVLLYTVTLRAEVTLSSGLDYSTGYYGLPVSTEITTIPFPMSYVVNQTTWELSLPYLRIKGPGEVVPGIGRFTRRLVLLKTVNQGLGDLTLGVTRQFAVPADQPWSWAAGAEVKIGTADADQYLGTGQDDFATHVDVYYTAGPFTPFVTLGYRWLGNPPGSNLRNYLFGTVGFSWACTDKVTLGLLLDWAEKTSAGGESSANLTLSASRAFGENWQAQVYGMLGSSDSSADYGLGLGASRRF
ncbi:MAG: hypothetical protein EXS42_09475 [Lacunisphaera sp.]|nr:hypothetical protein [Lacunisphaera sp.]